MMNDVLMKVVNESFFKCVELAYYLTDCARGKCHSKSTVISKLVDCSKQG